MRVNVWHWWALAEGVVVMAVELCGGMILSAYYGNTLQVWSVVVGITFLGLAFGYLLGGWVSEGVRSLYVLGWLWVGAAVLVALVPESTRLVFVRMIDKGFVEAALVTGVLVSGLPCALIASAIPVLTSRLARKESEAGRMAGVLFSLSSAGGIISALVVGLLLVPAVGIRLVLVGSALVLVVFVVWVWLVRYSAVVEAGVAFVLVLFMLLLTYARMGSWETATLRQLYHHDGIIGQIRVMDSYTQVRGQGRVAVERQLFINNIPQTRIRPFPPNVSLWNYVHGMAVVSALARLYARHTPDVLLIGVGGGSLVAELLWHGYNVTAVDIERRLRTIAQDYFFVDMSRLRRLVVDDGRHFVNVAPARSFDLIVMDVLSAESQPFHLYTQESFAQFFRILRDSGLVVIEWQETITDTTAIESGRAAFVRMLAGMRAAGFEPYWFSPTGDPQLSDIILVGVKGRLDIRQMLRQLPLKYLRDCCLSQGVVLPGNIALQLREAPPAVPFHDNEPELEYLMIEEGLQWRRNKLNYMIDAIRGGFRLFR